MSIGRILLHYLMEGLYRGGWCAVDNGTARVPVPMSHWTCPLQERPRRIDIIDHEKLAI